MPIEKTRRRLVAKPWGVHDLRPWSNVAVDGEAIGEMWFEREGTVAEASSLLLKLLFTGEPLSIQVHPDDERAQAMDLPNGKTEAWYVLAARQGAEVALGLKQPLDRSQLKQSIRDGSIANEIAWQPVATDDAFYVPAGTIHAIGAGLVLAEIQQRSDATFRMFDHGRDRILHPEEAAAAAILSTADFQVQQCRMSDERTLLLSNPHFVLERIELPAGSKWSLTAQRESWLLVLSGTMTSGSLALATGEAIFAEMAAVDVAVGPLGLQALIAYVGLDGPQANLLARFT